LANTKKSYKKCSVKGCRKKAITGGKCREHAKKAPSHLSLDKEISGSDLRHKAKKIRRVRESAEALSKKPKRAASSDKESVLRSLCFEAGIILGKIGRLVENR
jgi:hypothetical protein